MSDETTEGTAAEPALRTLADKVNWLIDRARPPGRGRYTNVELAALIEQAWRTGVAHHCLETAERAGGQPEDEADRGARADLRRASWLLLR